MTPRARNLLERLLLLIMIAAIAVASVSSFWIAGLVGAVTILVVLLDMIATARRTEPARFVPSAEPTPQSFRVDLDRRS